MVVVCLEGNMASGKSTVLSLLSETATVFPEPVEEWGKWLDDYYKDPHRWAAQFQMNVLLSFRDTYSAVGGDAYVERSPLACRNVFGRLISRHGFWTAREVELFETLYRHVSWKPDVYVYLRTSPDVCWGRMKLRGRDAERNVNQEYVTDVHVLYEEAMSSEPDVVIVDVNPDWQPERVAQEVRSAVDVWMATRD